MLGGGPGRPSRGQNRQAPMASSRCCGRLDHRVTATGTVTRTMSPNHPCPGACPAPSRRRARPGAGCFAEFADGGLGEGLARPDGSAAFPVAPGLPAHARWSRSVRRCSVSLSPRRRALSTDPRAEPHHSPVSTILTARRIGLRLQVRCLGAGTLARCVGVVLVVGGGRAGMRRLEVDGERRGKSP